MNELNGSMFRNLGCYKFRRWFSGEKTREEKTREREREREAAILMHEAIADPRSLHGSSTYNQKPCRELRTRTTRTILKLALAADKKQQQQFRGEGEE